MSTTTTNLNLIKPETTDPISPNGYNSNFDVIDQQITNLKVDYVTSSGTSGNWQYRQWSSGMAECWIESYTVAQVRMIYDWGSSGTYTGYIDSPGNYPFTFISPPLVIPTFCSQGSGTTTYSFPIWARPNGTTTTCPGFQGTDPTYGTINNLKLAIYVKGRWK